MYASVQYNTGYYKPPGQRLFIILMKEQVQLSIINTLMTRVAHRVTERPMQTTVTVYK